MMERRLIGITGTCRYCRRVVSLVERQTSPPGWYDRTRFTGNSFVCRGINSPHEGVMEYEMVETMLKLYQA